MSSGHSYDNNTTYSTNNNTNNNNNNGPRHVYVHHVNEDPHHSNHMTMGYPPPPPPPMHHPQQQTIPMYIPMPIPQPQPIPMPMFMGGYSHPPHQMMMQPPVIIINGSNEQPPSEEENDDEDEKESSPPKATGGARPFHPISFVSVIFFIIASILGFICVAKIYDVFESSMNDGTTYNNENIDEATTTTNDGFNDHNMLDYLVVHRTVALGMGAASILMFSIAFLLSFYAGMRYRMKSNKSSSTTTSKRRANCCLGGLLIAAWILFCLTFINGLIILVLAFDEEARIYPEVALSAVIGNMAAWICMFGYSQLARRG